MKASLPKREPEILAKWAEQKLYHRIQEAGVGRPLYILHDGPPYANGHIHIGHALNKILKDIIIKSKTMEGYQAPYIPGWDCHGLPIEHQVAKELGPKKKDLSAVELRRLCRDYAEKFYQIQREEFKRLGVFADWELPYLTMDREYESAIIREFGKFVENGGVYKGLKPVLWCTFDQTALAEAEVEYENYTSPYIYVKFPMECRNQVESLGKRLGISIPSTAKTVSIVIWTTTPWTLPANQALALHPNLDYAFVHVGEEVWVIAEKLIEDMAKTCRITNYQILGTQKGKEGFEGILCQRPLTEGLSPILLGDFVTLDQGTGCVHIAPGHGMEDYLLALKYNNRTSGKEVVSQTIEIVVPVGDDGCFKDTIQGFAGQHVLKANSAIIEKLKDQGVLVDQGFLDHSYPHCWRCKKPVIFRATQQWFVSMEKSSLRSRALKEIDRVKWIPSRGRDRIYGMMANRPDWCLSRQRTWGTPIPGFTCVNCETTLADARVITHVADLAGKSGSDVWFQKTAEELVPPGTSCGNCGGSDFKKEQDILDVWFESGVSHTAVLKTRGLDWWPASLYLEGSDQHRGWFHSALLASVTTDKQAPYQAVLTHGFVVDGAGRKMSKSAGNVVTPQEVIKQYGAEILRLWVATQDYQEDLRLSQTILKQLVESYRKIRNTCRYLLSNLYDYDPTIHSQPLDQLPELDRWALMRLNNVIVNIRKSYEIFDFRQIMHELDYFCAVDMSATYLDILKDRLYTFPKESPLRRGSQTVLLKILMDLATLMAPILSFTAEEIWQMLPKAVREKPDIPSVHLASFPQKNFLKDQEVLENHWEYLLSVRTVVQGALEIQRRNQSIGSSLEARVILGAEIEKYDLLKKHESELPEFFIVSQVSLEKIKNTELQHQLHSNSAFGVTVDVVRAEGRKCERCWNYRPSVGAYSKNPSLCDRCAEAVR